MGVRLIHQLGVLVARLPSPHLLQGGWWGHTRRAGHDAHGAMHMQVGHISSRSWGKVLAGKDIWGHVHGTCRGRYMQVRALGAHAYAGGGTCMQGHLQEGGGRGMRSSGKAGRGPAAGKVVLSGGGVHSCSQLHSSRFFRTQVHSGTHNPSSPSS